MQKDRQAAVDVLVAQAREKAPFYGEKYRDTASGQMPPVLRAQELGEHFFQTLCGKNRGEASLAAFLKEKQNAGARWGAALVVQNSGEDGRRIPFLHDKASAKGFDFEELLGCEKDIRQVRQRGGRCAVLCAQDGFGVGSVMAGRAARKLFLSGRAICVNALWAPSRVSKKLTAFAPQLLYALPSALERLVKEKEEGRLRIYPAVIVCAEEALSPEQRERFEKTFGCPVRQAYVCAQAGVVARGCEKGHMHVVSSRVLLEPVDAKGRAAAPGEVSEGVLITNLVNRYQPVLRMEKADRVVLQEGCACGLETPWVRVVGKRRERLRFESEEGPVLIEPEEIRRVMEQDTGAYQVVQLEDGTVAVRLPGEDASARIERFKRAYRALSDLLTLHGATQTRIVLDGQAPRPEKTSARFVSVYSMKKEE